MIEFIIILSFALFVRLFPVRNTITDSDTYGHVYFAHEVKKQKTSPWGFISMKCWKTDKFRHPFLWHWFVGRVSLRLLLPNLKWINAIFDGIFAFLIYLILKYIFQESEAALIGMLLYLFTPMWFSGISIGTRIASFTPRLLSEIFVNIVLLLIIFDFGLPYWTQFMIALIGSIVTILSSKFGLQAIIFILPLTYVVSGSWLSFNLISILFISLTLLMLVSSGETMKMMKRQFVHLTEYYRNNKSKDHETVTGDRNNFSSILVKSDNNRIDYYRTIWNLLATNSYTSTFFKMPIYTLVIVMSIFAISSGKFELSINIFSPLIAASFLFFFINRPTLLFLGEAERYLNHIAIFIIMASINLAQSTGLIWLIWCVIFYGICYWLCESFLLNKIVRTERQDADTIVENYLKSNKKKRLISSFPYHNFNIYRIMLLTQHNVIFPIYMDKSIREDFVKNFEPHYGYLDLSKLNDINKLTGLDTLILDKKTLIAEGFSGWAPPDSWMKVELSQSIYDIYELS